MSRMCSSKSSGSGSCLVERAMRLIVVRRRGSPVGGTPRPPAANCPDGYIPGVSATKPATDYPRHWEADVLLSDGQVAHLRPIGPDDEDRLVAFYDEVSA